MDDELIMPGRPFNYRGRDAAALLTAMLERVPSTLPEWTGYTSEADVGRVLLELFAHMGDILGYYTDAVANESFLGTAQTRRGVLQHLRLIGYQLSTAVPATADLTITISVATKPETQVLVEPGASFSTESGPDAPSVRFEYAGARAFVFEPGDWGEVEDGKCVATKTLPVAEGRRISEVIGVSDGTPHQRFALPHAKVVLHPTGIDPDLTINDGSTPPWVRQETLAFSGADQPHFAVEVDDQDRGTVVFGDRVPPAHTEVRATYRVGGGEHGNVRAGTIAIDNAPSLNALGGSVTNVKQAAGGAERETIDHAVRQAPSVFRTLGRAVTTGDYETQALAFGGVGKVRASSAPGGLVVLTVAPSGGGDVSNDLASGLQAYFEDKRAIGTRIRIDNPKYIPIYVAAVVDVDPYFSNVRIANQVRAAVRAVLSFDRAGFGQTLYLSKFYEAIEAIDGVAGVNITEFARDEQTVPLPAEGKIGLGEIEVAAAPGPGSGPHGDWGAGDLANGVRVTANGGFP